MLRDDGKMESSVLLKCSRIHHTKHMPVHLQSFADFWPDIRRNGFIGIRIFACGFDKGVAKSLDERIEEFLSKDYDPTNPDDFLNWAQDWHLFIRCCVHIAMTAQEKAVKADLNEHEEKLKMGYIIVSSLRSHFVDIVRAFRTYLLKTRWEDSDDNYNDVTSACYGLEAISYEIVS